MDNVFAYPDSVWRRFIHPAHAGELQGDESRSAEAGSPAAKSLLRISVKLEQGSIGEACFRAYGCPVTIAVGDWLAEWLMGKGLSGLKITPSDIRAALEIPEDKAHCALMGEDVIRRLSQQV